ncbi:hypothetical protein F4677DRAFT_314379 [Hypoxylon crocopeplum]|nr:hypothetical protein F4677DRAFT_314379 [Hypoxylon crocopeplum]
MYATISLFSTLTIISLAIASPIASTSEPDAGTTTCLPSFPTPSEVSGSMSIFTPTPITPPAASPTLGSPSKTELSICCCCMSEPQPEVSNYMAMCPRAGVQAVCGDSMPVDSDFTLGGLEGKPEEIAKVCSSARCGSVAFID